MGSNQMIIVGCGGHARSVSDVLLANEPRIQIVFVDENAINGEKIFGFDVVKKIEPKGAFHVAMGNNERRKSTINKMRSGILSTIISKNAYLGKGCIIDKGVFVANGVFLGPMLRIGRGSIINTGSIIEHETKIGRYCHVASGSTLCGRCNIQDEVLIGAGSIVIDKINICSNVIIGANSTVIEDITISGTYVGSPAKKVK